MEDLQNLTRVIHSSKETVCVISPWNDPKHPKRIWCCYEMMQTLRAPPENPTRLTMMLPPTEFKSFQAALLTDLDAILRPVSAIDCRTAEATKESDKVSIMNEIDRTVGSSS